MWTWMITGPVMDLRPVQETAWLSSVVILGWLSYSEVKWAKTIDGCAVRLLDQRDKWFVAGTISCRRRLLSFVLINFFTDQWLNRLLQSPKYLWEWILACGGSTICHLCRKKKKGDLIDFSEVSQRKYVKKTMSEWIREWESEWVGVVPKNNYLQSSMFVVSHM